MSNFWDGVLDDVEGDAVKSEAAAPTKKSFWDSVLPEEPATPERPRVSEEALARAAAADQIAEDRMRLATPGAKAAGFGMNFNKGLPFVGGWVDEAYNAISPGAGDRANQLAESFARENPKTAMGAQIGGGLVGSVPLAAAAAPALTSAAPATVGARALVAAPTAAVVGGTEGAIQGAGRGDPGDRASSAMEGGIIGAGAGLVLGAAGPYAAEGVKKVLTSLRGTDVSQITKTLGITPAAARVVKRALDVGNIKEAEAALKRGGKDAMLADAGQPAAELLDAAANAGGKAGKIARDAVDTRTNVASAKMQKSLDRHLGTPIGKETAKKAIREGTKTARQTAYDAAYSQPIDYASGAGRNIEGLMPRVPQSAINRANELMRLEGADSKQIMARIGDNGLTTFEKMPDVRQLDYITRALNDVADQADGQGKLGGTTALGNATKQLSKRIRASLKSAVPEYSKALDVASDSISQVNATDLGFDLLKKSTKREAVAAGLEGASKAEREAAKQGLRSYIDDTLADVSRTITDGNTTAREGIKLIKDMSSRANIEKMERLLGGKAARDLAKELDQQAVAFELRAAIATNSKTAIRQGIQGAVEEQTGPTVLETLTSGSPVEAGKRFVQALTGNTAEAQAVRRLGVYEEIAKTLTQTRGRKAKSALRLIEKAIEGQKLTEQQAAYIGTVMAGTGVLSGSREASRQLSTR